MKYLIFDFDGVLGDTLDVAATMQVQMGDFQTYEDAVIDIKKYSSNKPNHTRGHSLSTTELKEMHTWINTLGLKINKAGFGLFEDFIAEIKRISDVQIAIVSSGSREYVVPAMEKSQMHPTHILAFEDHHSKEEKVETILADWGVNIEQVYYITDSLADVYELKDLIQPGKLIGVSWGFCSQTELAQELDEKYILTHPQDIHKVLSYA